MRICFISRRFFPAISGMSVYADNLVRRLAALGHDVTMISQFRGDAFGTQVYGGGPPPSVPGVRVVGREQTGEQADGNFERDIADLVTTIVHEHRRAPFDVLHAQYGYPPGWAALLAGRELGLPVVVSIQGGDGHWVGSCCRTHELAMQRVLGHANVVLIGGTSFASEVSERLGTPRERFTIVPGAVDTERFYPNEARELGSLRAPPVLLYHGRMDRRKGALDFAEALRRLAPQHAFRALYSGIGPDFEEARQFCTDHALLDRVHFAGYVAYDDVSAVYREADVFVSPTYAEGFSNTVLEAMASGLPIVSCRAVGVVDCLRDDENALLVEPGAQGALSGALERILGDGQLRARLAATALAECRRTYSWHVVAERIVAAYERALREPAAAPGWPAELPVAPCRFRATPHLL